jgi:hypothetical protein
MNTKLKDFTDRELLELIISNQTNLAQRLFRMNDFFIHKYGKEYIEKIEHKEPAFSKLLSEHESLLRQIRSEDNS